MNSDLLPISVAAAVGIASFAMLPDATAFERTQTCDSYGTYQCRQGERPRPISWPVRCVKYRINDKGSDQFPSSDGTISEELEELVVDAFESWNEPSCADFKLVHGGLTSASEAKYNENGGVQGNMNLVVWRDDNWPYSNSTNAFALTSVTYDSEEAVITDADIEINSDFYEFDHLESSQVGEDDAEVDLLNTLTHEVGHFVGLDHPDDPEATMYGRAPPGEIRKRSLEEDDIDGICAIYPARDENITCRYSGDFLPAENPRSEEDPPPSSGCSLPRSSGGHSPITALVFGVLLLVGWRRRQRRSNE